MNIFLLQVRNESSTLVTNWTHRFRVKLQRDTQFQNCTCEKFKLLSNRFNHEYFDGTKSGATSPNVPYVRELLSNN